MRSRHRVARARCREGFTIVELLAALAIMALLMGALAGVANRSLQTMTLVNERNELVRQAGFAMERMERAVRSTRRLLLPLNDVTLSDWREHVREQTFPLSPPEGSSRAASAVLAVTLPRSFDADGDGIPDADNDGDGLLDEDLGDDAHNDSASGVFAIDDAGDGLVDESLSEDDDEFLLVEGEDPIDGVDDDGDGTVDEDPSADTNGDACPGRCYVDDDGDDAIDEGSLDDDDEDGLVDEDWYDPLVFYLAGSTLRQRTPVPWDANASGSVTGRDFLDEPIAEHVTRFRVERVPQGADRAQLVDLTLELTGPSGEQVRLHARARVGTAQ